MMQYQACMVGFVLKNTLSDNGGVTRGVCKVDENRYVIRDRGDFQHH